MQNKNKRIKTSFSTILWAVMTVLLCASVAGARDVTGELNLGTDYDESRIEDDWLNVKDGGTLNMYAGSYVEYGVYAWPGSTVNIRGGEFGIYGYLSIYAATSPDEDPFVAIYGIDFHVDNVYYSPGSSYLISGVTLEGYYDEEKTQPFGFWISANAPIFLALPGGCVTTVEIDIKPGSDLNPINQGSNGLIPVAILTTEAFNAADVDPGTVTLNGANVALRGKSDKLMARLEDVDGDGDEDLMLQVDTESWDELWADGEVTLTGKTYSAEDIQGTDYVIIVPPQ